jgi:protein dithiol oxidoreductase (disulfide-forming)
MTNALNAILAIAAFFLLSLPIRLTASPSFPLPVFPHSGRPLDTPQALAKAIVQMEVFFDFHCGHCHEFVTTVLPQLKRQFGKALHIQYVGFPVVENQSPLPFQLYEAARVEGKGEAMVHALFGILQDDHRPITQMEVQEKIFQRLGLDSQHMTEHLASGLAQQRVQTGIERAEHLGLTFTPAVVVDGAFLVIDTSAKNLGAVIQHAMSKKREEANSQAELLPNRSTIANEFFAFHDKWQ